MPILLTIGTTLFFGGGLIFLALLFSSGGAARSRQFEVLGHLWSGRMGSRRRGQLLLSLGLIGTGVITCFSGVAAMDAERAARCRDVCVAAGYATGRIGPSVDRTPKGRFVACTCPADDKPALELRADTLKP